MNEQFSCCKSSKLDGNTTLLQHGMPWVFRQLLVVGSAQSEYYEAGVDPNRTGVSGSK